MKKHIKTTSDLVHAVTNAGHSPHFFTRETMRFFGDTMANYSVRRPRIIATREGDALAYELARKKPVRHGLQDSAFFKADTFERVFPSE